MIAAGVPVQDILLTVFQSIFQVFLLCLAGFALSFKGIVDKPVSKALNHINIALFTPALLFSKVAYFLSPAKLRQLWVIPIIFVVVTGISALIAHCLARAWRLKRSQVNFATAAAMFMNSNSLPVALMQSLVTTVPLLKWDPEDTADAMFGRSLTYLIVFSTLGIILRWSYGVRLLSQIDEPDSPSMPAFPPYRDSSDSGEHVAPPVSVQPADHDAESADDGDPWRSRPLRSRIQQPNLTSPVRRHTYPHSRLPAVPTSLGDRSESEDTNEHETTEGESEDTIALPSEPEDGTPHPSSSTADLISHSTSGRQDRRFLTRFLSALTSVSPPLVASLLSLLCVLVPPLQRLLNSKEMAPFKGALDNAGACSVPITLVVLGGWFWDEATTSKSKVARVDAGQLKGESNGKTKRKGKSVEERFRYSTIPAPVGERQSGPPASHDCAMLHVVPYSSNSSTSSLSSMIGTVGDVLMARIRPGGGVRRTKRRIRVTVLPDQSDAETGLLAAHTESEHEHGDPESERRHASRSRSRSRPRAEHATRPSPNSASPPSPVLIRGTNAPGETLTIIVTLLARMVIVPLVVTPLMVLISRLGWGGEVFEDPVFIVSSMLLVTSPPALTLAQISQRAKGSSTADADTYSPFERLFSRTVFWAYCVLTPAMTIVSVMVGLLLIEP